MYFRFYRRRIFIVDSILGARQKDSFPETVCEKSGASFKSPEALFGRFGRHPKGA